MDRRTSPRATVRTACAALAEHPLLALLTVWYALLLVGVGVGLVHAHATDGRADAPTELAGWVALPVYALTWLAAYDALGGLWRVRLQAAARASYL